MRDLTTHPARPVLSARGLAKSFGGAPAVDDVSIAVAAGERVALLGPNGAGKTTTLLMLLGAITPDSGTIELVGRRLPDDRARAMQQVGFVAGYLPLPQHLTVREALEFFAGLYGVRRPRPAIAATLARFGIAHLAPRRCEQLSSGERTLVGVCKAILHRPQLVVLDEPTASLDPDVAQRAREGLAALSAEEGTALLVTSHHMLEVERLCERVVFLARGRIVAEGTPADVVARFDQVDLESVFLQLADQHRRGGTP
jgi:ABC-2 type transport system ATP-binding protein